MRALLVGPQTSVHMVRWCCALAQRGVEVTLLTMHPVERAASGQTPRDQPYDVVAVHGSRLTRLARAVVALRRLAKQWQPDLVNAHYATSYGTVATLAKLKNPVVLSVWGSDVFEFPDLSPAHRRLVKTNLQRASMVASTSAAMAARVRELAPRCEAVRLTPFGVDCSKFRPYPRRDYPAVTIGTVKLLEHKYGIDLLIRAFALLSEDYAGSGFDLRLVIAGDGHQSESLQELAQRLGIGDRCEFLGSIAHDRVPDVLNSFDIYVAASRAESFGVAVIEASACRLPVVVAAVGGLPEVVLDGETGKMVPPDDVSALVAALAELVQDRRLREQMGAAGREFVVNTYEWDHCVNLMQAAYRDALAR